MIFLAIQSTYDAIELGLFDIHQCIEKHTISKFQASAHLIPILDAILKNNNKSWTDLSFCVVSQGPGPFTTLRTVIATMNGLSYATHIPLIGISALDVLIQECDPTSAKNVCALLQAFSGDVYVGLRKAHQQVLNLSLAGADLCTFFDSHGITELEIVGNGISLYEDILKKCLIPTLHLNTNLQHGSLHGLAHCGLLLWQSGNKGGRSLRPLYLKNHPSSAK